VGLSDVGVTVCRTGCSTTLDATAGGVVPRLGRPACPTGFILGADLLFSARDVGLTGVSGATIYK